MRPLIFEIIDLALKHNIPDELIINADQTPSKFVATDNVRMAKKGEKYISRAGATDKRAIKWLYVPMWNIGWADSSVSIDLHWEYKTLAKC